MSDSITTMNHVSLDLTKDAEYERLVAEEIEHYSGIEVTDKLTEGGLHDSSAWQFNYAVLWNEIFHTNVYEEIVTCANRRHHPRVLSIGCGYGGHELAIARRLRKPYEMVAVDLNPSIFQEAQRCADSEGLNIRFKPVDLNFVNIAPETFDVVYAIASVHHVLNLEHFFSMIHRGLKDDGRMILLDIIGKQQVLFWKENVEFAVKVVKQMPQRYLPDRGGFWSRWRRFDPYTIIPPYVEPGVQVGMEGIRQEEIEQVLGQWFEGEKVFHYNSFMRLICTNLHLAPRFDPDREQDSRYLRRLVRLDIDQVNSGKLRPTEVFGVFAKR